MRELPRDAAGQRHYAPAISIATRDEAEILLNLHASTMCAGEFNPNDASYKAHLQAISAKKVAPVKIHTNVADLLDEYAQSKIHPKNGRQSVWAPTIRYSNKNIADHIRNSELGDMNIKSVTEDDFEEYFETKRVNGSKDAAQSKKPLSENTIRKHFVFLRAALAWAVEKGKINKNPLPMNLQPGKTAPTIRFYSPEEENALLAVAVGTRALVLIALCCFLGLRRSEALGLTWADIGWKLHNVMIHSARTRVASQDYTGRTKTKYSARQLDLSDELLSVLREEQEVQKQLKAMLGQKLNDDDYIVVNSGCEKYSPNSANRLLDQICIAAGVENKGFHAMRHAFATMVYKETGDIFSVADALGHSDPNFTRRVYVQDTSTNGNKAVAFVSTQLSVA